MKRLAMVGVPDRRHYRRLMTHLRGLGYAVVHVSAGSVHHLADVVEANLPVPDYRAESIMSALGPYHRVRPLDGIARFHELTVEASSQVAAQLGLPHFPLDRVSACTDKLQMRRWMASREITCPEFAGVATIDQARSACRRIGYPVVIKPVRGGASYGVTRLDDDQALCNFFEHVGIFWEPRHLIVERFLPGHEVSVETLTDTGGRHVHLAVFDKPQVLDGPYFLEEMYVTPGWLSERASSAVIDTVSDMIERLGLVRCVTHTELRLTPAGPVIVEFGLRPIGWPGPLCVQAASGRDIVAAMAAIACGEPVDLAPPDPVAAAGWRYLAISHAGVITELPPVEAIRRAEATLDVSVWADIGDRVGTPPVDFNYIKGYLAVTGSTAGEVGNRLSSHHWRVVTSAPEDVPGGAGGRVSAVDSSDGAGA